ncbi:MAG TPA: hypothetical protein VGQ87_00525 [Patescibacteria group bacterium]|jgi:hypothetical protein|nr:hypothetical protein [Patescibacteria group bacterium]
MPLHAIMQVSGIPCANIQCLYVFDADGWCAVWQVDKLQLNGQTEPRWQIGVVTAGNQRTCPICEAKQKLPKLFDRIGAVAEVASYNQTQQTAGYFCRIDCSKAKVEPITDN